MRQAEARATGAEAMIAHLKLRHREAPARQVRGVVRARPQAARPVGTRVEELVATAAEDAARADLAEEKGRPGPRDTPPQAVARPAPRAPAARAGGASRPQRPARAAAASSPSWARTITETLEVIPRAVEGDPDSAGEVHLPLLRGDHPAAGTVPPHRPRPGGAEPAGDDPGGEVRPAPAPEPPERDLRPRGGRARACPRSPTGSAPAPPRSRR